MPREVNIYGLILGRGVSFLKIFALFIALIFFSSCSTSSVVRYKKSKPISSPEVNKDIRFTSANDSLVLLQNEFDEPPYEDVPVNKSKFFSEFKKLNSKRVISVRDKILLEIINYINSPYEYGGTTKKGIDCSAFTMNVFARSLDVKLPRTANQQFQIGAPVKKISELKFGDLIFFNTTRRSFPGHVGIYLGSNLFAHSSFSLGVTISSLESSYYKKRFVGGRRIIKTFGNKSRTFK